MAPYIGRKDSDDILDIAVSELKLPYSTGLIDKVLSFKAGYGGRNCTCENDYDSCPHDSVFNP